MDFYSFLAIAVREKNKNIDMQNFHNLQSSFWSLFGDTYHHHCSDFPDVVHINSHILDLETFCLSLPYKDVIFVHHKNNEVYVFLLKEMIEIIHHDLTKVWYEEDYDFDIITLVKHFTLPRNPYTNEVFSLVVMKSIRSQLLSKLTCFQMIHPHIIIFFKHLESFYALMKSDHYQMTLGIEELFEHFYCSLFWKSRKILSEKTFLRFINDIT